MPIRKRGPWVVVESLTYEYEGSSVMQVWVFKTRRGAENFHNRMVKATAPAIGQNPSLDYDTFEAGASR